MLRATAGCIRGAGAPRAALPAGARVFQALSLARGQAGGRLADPFRAAPLICARSGPAPS